MLLRCVWVVALGVLTCVSALGQFTADFVSPPDGSCERFFASITIHVGGPAPLKVKVQDELGNTIFNQTFANPPQNDLSFGYDPFALGVPDGPHILTLTVSGPGGQATDTLNIHTDITPPVPAITNPINGGCVNGHVSVAAAITDNYSGVGAWSLWIDGVKRSTGNDSPVFFDWDTTGLPDLSTHTLQLKAADICGNTANSPVITVLVKNNAPTLSNIVPPQGATVSGVVTIGAQILNGQMTDWWVAVDGGVTGISPVSGTGESITANWDTRTYSNGNHILELRVTDSCGNTNSTFLSITVSNQSSGGGGVCLPLKNLIYGGTPADPFMLLPVQMYRPQELNIDGVTLRDVFNANNVPVDATVIVQAVSTTKQTPYYKCLAFVAGPGSGLNTNFSTGLQMATNQDLDRPVCNVSFKMPADQECLGKRCLLFSPPGTTYTLRVVYVNRLPNGRVSAPKTIEMCWKVIIENRNDLVKNVDYFSTVAAGYTQKPKVDNNVIVALFDALEIPDDLGALIQFETVIALSAIDFSVLRDRKPSALLFRDYLVDSDEEPIGCLLLEQANALLWHP